VLTDYHTHTPLCGHAEGHPRDYALAAQKAGLAEIGLSDHNPMPTQFDEWRMAPHQLPEYLMLVEEARRDFPYFPIRLGLECDFISGYEDHIRHLLTQAPWDYLIGSVHYVRTPVPGSSGTETWDLDSPRHLKKWDYNDVELIWSLYFAEYAQMARSGLFDFLAHPDLVKKFCRVPKGDLSRFYKNAITAIAESGVALEVSTAGLRKDCGEIYPSKQFLEMAFKAKIPIVINSDAHNPAEVAYAFDKALTFAREVGYSAVCRFKDRKRVEVRI
jgi:histidinol-phosphatase (PHP family)